MTIDEEVQSLFMLHYPGTDAKTIRAFDEKYEPGGLILMGDNVPSSMKELAELTASATPDQTLPILFGIDQEGGVVSRLDSDTAPGAEELRKLSPASTFDAFQSRAALTARGGIQVNFGIVADVTSDPSSFIYDRVLGEDASSASERVVQAVKGEAGLVQSVLKHFPGHGAVAGDSHTMIPKTGLSYAQWLEQEAPPFEAGIDAGAEFVMFGHLAYTAVDEAPASLSGKWHEILRDQLGFRGISITDDMLMLQHSGLAKYQDPSENAIQALAVGNTMLLYVLPKDPATEGIDLKTLVADVVSAVASGRISKQQIDNDARKLLVLRLSLAKQHG